MESTIRRSGIIESFIIIIINFLMLQKMFNLGTKVSAHIDYTHTSLDLRYTQ